MTTAPAITMTGGNDWLAAAAAHRRRWPGLPMDGNRNDQVYIALRFLWERAQNEGGDTTPRAANIINALPGAPYGERILGIRDTDAPLPELPPEARELLERLGAPVPVPTVEPTAVVAPKAKGRAKAKAAAEEAEAS